MPNKYKYDYTFEELREEEDREVNNDYLRQKTSYYKTLDDINNVVYNVLKDMGTDELKQVIKNGLLVTPISRLK